MIPHRLTPEEQLDAEDALGQKLGEDRHLIELVRFGQDMEEFAATTIGKYFVNRAEGELNDAVSKLLDLNDLAGKDAAEAHAEAKIALKMLRWMDEAVTSGRDAERNIVGRDEAEQVVEGHDG